MSFTTRLGLFVAIAVVGLIAWQWNDSPTDLTPLAVRQFHDAGAAERLQQAALTQNWLPLVWPALLVLLGGVMFWDDVERWWKRDQG